METLLKHYNLTLPITQFDLPYIGSNNTTVGIHTGDGDYVLKHFDVPHSIASFQYEQDLLTWLANQSLSFAVPAPKPTTSGNTFFHDADGYHALMPMIEGQRPEHRNPIHAEAVGAALGELQTTLSQYPITPRPDMATFAGLNKLHPRVPHPESLTPKDLGWPQTKNATELCAWWRDEYQKRISFLDKTYPNLPRQVIHGDYSPGNTLYHQDHLSAILDFEFALTDARIMDVASGLTFTMRIWENDAPWDLVESFLQGYGQWIQLSELEITSIVDAIALRDTASVIWWLGRDLADQKIPDTSRMSDLHKFSAWFENHRSKLESLCIRA